MFVNIKTILKKKKNQHHNQSICSFSAIFLCPVHLSFSLSLALQCLIHILVLTDANWIIPLVASLTSALTGMLCLLPLPFLHHSLARYISTFGHSIFITRFMQQYLFSGTFCFLFLLHISFVIITQRRDTMLTMVMPS
jgi:hypothetical protein